MKHVKVRNALMVYTTESESGRVLTETAFRGEVIELDDEQADFKISGGEAVPHDEELSRPGDLPPLGDEASPEEALNWALAATRKEIEATLASDPGHRPLLEAALSLAQERELDAAAQLNAALGGGETPPEEQEQDGDQEEEDLLGDTGTAADSDEPQTPESIVQGTVDQVSAFLSHNPHLASEVMDAENALAVDKGKDPRAGVIEAVKAAAQHTD